VPYDPQDMLKLADFLFRSAGSGCHDETRFRAAISRCYYACWLTARDQLWGVDGRPTTGQARLLPRGQSGGRLGSHEQVIEALGVQPRVSRGAKRRKDQLASLKELRTVADYRHDDKHRDVQRVFGLYGVSSWEKLAQQAFTITANILPELRTIGRFN